MKIIIIGTRGIPNIQGGVEKHCEELYSRIAKKDNIQITIICRSSYFKEKNKTYKNILLKYFNVPQVKSIEAILQSFYSVIYAGFTRPDILHIHAVGPNLLTPIARLFGLNVVMTHHGYDYDRKKWGPFAKSFLKLGEWAGVRFANKVIAISPHIKNHIEHKYKRSDITVIPNGFNVLPNEEGDFYLKKYNIEKSKYIFCLARLVPEKGLEYLFSSFKSLNLNKNIKLVVAGDADHKSEYSTNLKKLAFNEGIIMTGFIKEKELAEIFSNSGLFILPSFHEGLSISLLEAMAYNLPILASDIPANLQFHLPAHCYFKVGDEQDLANKIKKWADNPTENINISYDLEKYNWDTIALNTEKVYYSSINLDVPESANTPQIN